MTQLRHRLILTGLPALAGTIASPAFGQTMAVTITIPRLSVAEYHRPYVAVWLEAPGAPAKTLAVWYDIKKSKNEGRKWLNEVRSWWRASGRTGGYASDGTSGATRAPGPQALTFTIGKAPLGTLQPGQYTLVVEAAREVGGREIVRLPFSWPPGGGVLKATGNTELGPITVTFKR